MRESQALLTILVRGGCSAAVVLRIHTTDPLQGSPPSVIALAGEWDGIYTSSDTGRSGSSGSS